MASTVYGIDVSKGTLDVSDGGSLRARFTNDPRGRQALIERVKETAGLAVEATGSHHKALAGALFEAGIPVAVANPCRSASFARAIGLKNKTDRADARTLALFGQSVELPLYAPPSGRRESMRQLARHRQRLVERRASAKVQLKEPGLDPLVADSLKDSIDFDGRQIARLDKQMRALIASCADLKEDMELLMSVPGFGWVSAMAYIAELGDAARFSSAKQAASFAGICPAQFQSGTSKLVTHLSKKGHSRLRRSSYHPAMACIRKGALCHDLYKRLLASGKVKMSAVAAVMHKLIRVAFAVLKTRTRFDLAKAGLTGG